jgi:hypothetical protein
MKIISQSKNISGGIFNEKEHCSGVTEGPSQELNKNQIYDREKLATKCDIHPHFIRGIKKGNGDPSLEDLAKISKELGAWLFDLVSDKRKRRTHASLYVRFYKYTVKLNRRAE